MRLRESGFALPETAAALLIVTLAAMLVVRSGGANAVARAQALARSSAARLAAELSEWTRRQGEASVAEPLAPWVAGTAGPALPCHEGDCDAAQGARHYLSIWRLRLLRVIPGVRAELCADQPPADGRLVWACDPSGSALVLKLGWPSVPGDTAFPPVLAVEIGPAG